MSAGASAVVMATVSTKQRGGEVHPLTSSWAGTGRGGRAGEAGSLVPSSPYCPLMLPQGHGNTVWPMESRESFFLFIYCLFVKMTVCMFFN